MRKSFATSKTFNGGLRRINRRLSFCMSCHGEYLQKVGRPGASKWVGRGVDTGGQGL